MPVGCGRRDFVAGALAIAAEAAAANVPTGIGGVMRESIVDGAIDVDRDIGAIGPCSEPRIMHRA